SYSPWPGEAAETLLSSDLYPLTPSPPLNYFTAAGFLTA
ncbi:unnamed protein product, partial [marine sediment metagenome]